MKSFRTFIHEALEEASPKKEIEEDAFDLKEASYNYTTNDEFISHLEQQNIQYSIATFDNGLQVVVIPPDKTKDISERMVFDEGSLTEATRWIWDQTDWTIAELIKPTGVGNFWDNSYFPSLYHATPSENVPSILKHGLNPQNKTRGIANRGTGSAIFMSEEIEAIESYGDAIFEIDASKMKDDDYTPEITSEEPVQNHRIREAIANKLGIENWYEDAEPGVEETTYICYDNIPPKYLTLLDN